MTTKKASMKTKKTMTKRKTTTGAKRPRRVRVKRVHGFGGPFGEGFFKETLPKMATSCPCAEGWEPVVTLHLGDGALLDVVSVVETAERYVVLAVFNEGVGADGVERTADDVGLEAVPYELILRASVRTQRKRAEHRFGFAMPGAAHGKKTAEAKAEKVEAVEKKPDGAKK